MNHSTLFYVRIVTAFSCLISASMQSCSTDEPSPVKIVDVSDCKDCSVYEMFDSLEVISLDDQPDALLGTFPRLKDCQDYFIVEKHPNFYIFEKNGNLVASTQRILGHGQGEASSMIGCSYNPYSKQIEILTFGALLKYDLGLNYISEHSLPCDMGNAKNPSKNAGSWFQYIYDLSSTEHLLMASSSLGNNRTIFFFDSKENKISGQISINDAVISTYCSQQRDCFYRDGEQTYICPPYIMNQFYSFDSKTRSLSPVVQLDFGVKTLTCDDITPHTSRDYMENQQQVFDFLWFHCDKHFPLQYAITGNRLFVLVHGGVMLDNWYLLEVNLATSETRRMHIAEGDNQLIFPQDFSASDGYVYGIENDEERIRHFISSFKYQDRIKYSGRSDTLDFNNAVIFKYKVKESL